MLEIWQELSNFQTTSQRLADQVRTIIKNGWFSDLEIIEIHQKINDQQSGTNNTLPSTLNNNKQIKLIRKEPLTSKNENSTQPNTAQSKKQNKKKTQKNRTNNITRTKVISRIFKENYEQ